MIQDYSKGKIYKLISDKVPEVYVGSCLCELNTRYSGHKNKSNKATSKKLFTDDAIVKIELLENFPCNNINELKARELYYIKTLPCINKNKPFICHLNIGPEWMKEYYKANKEKITEQVKQFSERNPEYHKDYYQDNKEKITEQYKQFTIKHPNYQKEYREAKTNLRLFNELTSL